MSALVDRFPEGAPLRPPCANEASHLADGPARAHSAFLAACGLPEAWAGQAQWRILETGFGLGRDFLATWQAWRQDPQRPRLLHYVATEAVPASAAAIRRHSALNPELDPLAEALAAQWWGLLPGVHRLAFDGGRVLLTLYLGDTHTLLRKQALTVDSVFLHAGHAPSPPGEGDVNPLKALARCCRPGTRLGSCGEASALHDALGPSGFVVQESAAPFRPPQTLQATFAPRWTPRRAREAEAPPPARPAAGNGSAPQPPASADTPDCLVVGAGLAGAAVAASLARRGWRVWVLDQGPEPAAGASGLPAGLFSPHVSPDDSGVSRLSRSGVRATLHTATEYLQDGTDWQATGVLQHHVDGKRGLPADWEAGPGADWSHAATEAQRQAAGISPGVRATWHPRGGWIRPARLVQAQLAQPGIRFVGGQAVARLLRVETPAGAPGSTGLWQALDAQGQVLASAPLAVVATGFGSLDLLGASHPALAAWPLNTVRGQVSGARQADLPWPGPAFPVNGHGNGVPRFPWPNEVQDKAQNKADASPPSATADGSWIAGSTFERGPAPHWPPRAEDQAAAHRHNLGKLQALLPGSALCTAQAPHGLDGPSDPLHPDQHPALPPGLRHWAGIRCTSPDRLPLVGPVDAQALPGLWICTAMGARGLTLSLLCGELLAARLMGEPLPVEAALAKALESERLSLRAHRA
ncbi:MAG: FAD-dependent oxidoreductase [Burkholderiaceae bacterium]|nr:FAD-dependent oxidoreductase [Burkholderiaceae bacterium]